MSRYDLAIHREGRLAKKLMRLGTGQPSCMHCDMTDCRCLFRPRRGSVSAPIRCRNCHAKRTGHSAAQLQAKAVRFEDAGYTNPACVACSEADLRTLELDHIAGIDNSALVTPLCLNCHAIKSDDAEDMPWAQLRLQDPERSALVLQAAFEFGLACVLGLYAAANGHDDGQATHAVFFGLIALALIAWAMWNLSADQHFTHVLGPGYDKAIPASVPS